MYTANDNSTNTNTTATTATSATTATAAADFTLTEQRIAEYADYLRTQELAEGTIDNYLRHLRLFADYLKSADCGISQKSVAEWKNTLNHKNLAVSTVNQMIISVSRFLKYAGLQRCAVRTNKTQRKSFIDPSRQLDRSDFDTLLARAVSDGQARLAHILETIFSTGIRVSELQFITAEAAKNGFADVLNKGKQRRVIFSGKLRGKLSRYARDNNITAGPLFVTRTGHPISRRQVWGEMKKLAEKVGLELRKVFPHNLRHLFARTYYNKVKNLPALADLLGHSNIETTRIYLVTTAEEHIRILDSLDLVT